MGHSVRTLHARRKQSLHRNTDTTHFYHLSNKMSKVSKVSKSSRSSQEIDASFPAADCSVELLNKMDNIWCTLLVYVTSADFEALRRNPTKSKKFQKGVHELTAAQSKYDAHHS